tara:strand:- start:274 stop:723 length:450 start_codon:yes stop_codon:yes gene_type:complete
MIKQLFTKRKFYQFKDGKFLKIDPLFVAFLIAINIATFGLQNSVKYGFEYTFFEVIFFLPFLILAGIYLYKFLNPDIAVEDISDYWSKLDYLSNQLDDLSIEETKLRDKLNDKFKDHFGVSYDEGIQKWYNKFQPWLIPISTLIIATLF